MTREHVVTTRPHPLETHASSRPDDECFMEPTGPAAVRPRLAVQVDSGHTEAGDQHCEASEQEDCAADSKASPGNDEPVLVKDDDKQPDGQ